MSRKESYRIGAATQCFSAARLTLFLWFLRYICSVSAQEGFLSIDCGSEANSTVDGLFWQEDTNFVQGGEIGSIKTSVLGTSVPRYLRTLRFFPPDPEFQSFSTSCYQVPVDRGRKYLIRATFFYGNYDNQSFAPTFDLGVGLTLVARVQTSLNGSQEYEIIMVSRTASLLVCLNQVQAESIPFISSLEVRELSDSMYTAATQTTALITALRVNFGSTTTQTVRWPDDDFDRIWQSDTTKFLSSRNDLRTVSTDQVQLSQSSGDAPNQPPELVMRTAVAVNLSSETIYIDIPYSRDPSVPYIAAYFSNIIDEGPRSFNVHVNDFVARTLDPQPLAISELVIDDLPELTGPFSLNITDTNGGGAFINGLEVYSTTSVLNGTNSRDRKALKTVQDAFSQLKMYFGDPCLPFTWDWVNCTDSGGDLRITSINLSSRGLTGPIPAAIADLNLRHLWLDNNELQGLIPELSSVHDLQTLHLQDNLLSGPVSPDLAHLDSLTELYIQYNTLSGVIPQVLSSKRGLDLRFEGNAQLCLSNGTCGSSTPSSTILGPPAISDPTDHEGKSKSSSIFVVIGGAVGATFALIVFICLLAYFCCFKKNRKGGLDVNFDKGSACLLGCWQRLCCSKCFRTKSPKVSHINSVGVNISKARTNGLHSSSRGTLENSIYKASTDSFREAQAFRPVDIKKATRNYISKIGEGGFGPVYYGRLSNNMEIAVKVRSNHSRQGAREFATEVEILSRAKHPNLVALIGHCQETKDYMLIYEYLAGGTLQEHLYGVFSENPLDWKTRLKIAVDAAKGLEYLHNDCFPTIIHRDVKSSNILLTANFDAKVADFGLSKFLEGQSGHVSTIVKGTSGYLDPEYYESQRLTHKSDVYSFGIVLLEILTAREPLNTKLPRSEWKLSDWTRKHLLEGDLDAVVDVALTGNYNVQAMWKVAELAMTCVEPRSIHRPTMNEVVTELQSAVEIEAEGHTVLALPIAYHREDPYLLEPARQYHSQSFGRNSSSRLSNGSARLPSSVLPASDSNKS